MGAGPEQTGVHSNSWLRPLDFFWPTIFHQAHLDNLTTAMYTDHQVVLNLLNPGDADFLSFIPNSQLLTDNFVSDVILQDRTPECAFIVLLSLPFPFFFLLSSFSLANGQAF